LNIAFSGAGASIFSATELLRYHLNLQIDLNTVVICSSTRIR
ncbi:hypothetical protein SOVF_201910, partial [Spinacia oleracea]